jgi:adenylate kinase
MVIKVILITGTPGTGKSSLAKELSLSTHWKVLDLKKFVQKHTLAVGYDRERKSQIVDSGRLARELVKFIDAYRQSHDGGRRPSGPVHGLIIEGHMSHFLPVEHADTCIVTKTHISELNRRLMSRRYHKAKIRENLESEIFDICLEEARNAGHRIMVIDTTRLTPRQAAAKVMANLRIRGG